MTAKLTEMGGDDWQSGGYDGQVHRGHDVGNDQREGDLPSIDGGALLLGLAFRTVLWSTLLHGHLLSLQARRAIVDNAIVGLGRVGVLVLARWTWLGLSGFVRLSLRLTGPATPAPLAELVEEVDTHGRQPSVFDEGLPWRAGLRQPLYVSIPDVGRERACLAYSYFALRWTAESLRCSLCS